MFVIVQPWVCPSLRISCSSMAVVWAPGAGTKLWTCCGRRATRRRPLILQAAAGTTKTPTLLPPSWITTSLLPTFWNHCLPTRRYQSSQNLFTKQNQELSHLLPESRLSGPSLQFIQSSNLGNVASVVRMHSSFCNCNLIAQTVKSV